MTLDFNQLRLNIQRDYNSVVELINHEYDDIENSIILEGFDIEHLRVRLNDLRAGIATLMCVYTDTPEMIDNISSKAKLSTFEIAD